MAQTFGEAVRQIRTREQVSVSTVAGRLGCTTQRIYQIENSSLDPRLSTVVRVAEALGVTAVEIVECIE